jgi:hypothetical protein
VQFLDLDKVTHFFGEGKLTYAVVAGKNFVVDRRQNSTRRSSTGFTGAIW